MGGGFGEERRSNFSYDELMTMMTLWSMFRSPLMIGGELTKMSEEDLSLLTNKYLLSFMEDGWKANQIYRDDTLGIWKTQNSATGQFAFAIFNLSDEYRDIEVDIEKILQTSVATIMLKDIWTENLCQVEKNAVFTIPKHGVKAFIVQ